MNELDRDLVSIFKTLAKRPVHNARQERAVSDFRHIRMRLGDPSLCCLLDQCVQDVVVEPEKRRKLQGAEVAEVVRKALELGFAELATWLFIWWRAFLAELPVEEVLQLAPSAAALDAWRKATRAAVGDLEDELLARVTMTYATAGAEWLLLKGKPSRLGPLFDLFLARGPRPKRLASWADALAGVLKKDKRGRLLAGILGSLAIEDDRLSALVEVVRLNKGVLRTAVEALPAVLAQKGGSGLAMPFARQIFEKVVERGGAERELLTALLARLGTGILLIERRGPQAIAALQFIEGTARQLRNATRDDSERGRTWVLESLRREQEISDGEVHVSIEGARHLVLALEKAAQGFSASEILSVTAQNVGLAPVGKQGERLSYDPLRHEDAEGGMLPGDSARVEEPGWSYRGEVVMRAKVGKP